MSRNCVFGLAVSLLVCGVANAQPQAVSYFHNGSLPVVLTSALPAQGFVLTDVACATPLFGTLYIYEVNGQSVSLKTQLLLGQDQTYAAGWSYHFHSGIPFVGGRGLQIEGSVNGCTLSGYIPGTGSGSVPALGSFGLGILLLAMMAFGGAIIRKKRVVG